VPSDASSGGDGSAPKTAAGRRGSITSSQQLQPQLEGSDRIRFLVAALVDPTKNAAAAMELQVQLRTPPPFFSHDADAAAEHGSGLCQSVGHRTVGRAAGPGGHGGRQRRRAGACARGLLRDRVPTRCRARLQPARCGTSRHMRTTSCRLRKVASSPRSSGRAHLDYFRCRHS
jgi:hypothetical protein